MTLPTNVSPGYARSVIVAVAPIFTCPDVLLGNVGDDPHGREVGDAEDLLTRLHLHAFNDDLLDDDARNGRGPIDGAGQFRGVANLPDGVLRQPEITQALCGIRVVTGAGRG